MNAVDTNVLVRFLLQDEPEQFARARHLFEIGTVYLSRTVMLESFWVLRKQLGFPQSHVLRLLSAVSRLPTVILEDALRFERTLALTDTGMGFADALHLTAAEPDVRFATFDKGLIHAAQRAGMSTVFAP
ncbi:MAG: type II toxin-antitoxin system VapC family toxin [Gemmobacter sp.]